MYQEVEQKYICPVVAVDAVANPLVPQPHFYVFGYILKVLGLGTATYLDIGDSNLVAGAGYRLTAAAQTFQWFGTTSRTGATLNDVAQVVDLHKIWIVADQSDISLNLMYWSVPIYALDDVIRTEVMAR